MEKNLSISNFKFLPMGFLLFVLLIALAEMFIFSKGYYFSDMSTVSVVKKAKLIEKPMNPDIAIFGASRSLAIDANAMVDKLDGYDTAYNYSVPSFGTSMQFYMMLRKYLDNNEKPKAILLSLGPEIFGTFEIDRLFYSLWSGEAARLRRFFSIHELMKYMPVKEKILILPIYSSNILPSVDYRYFLRNYIEDNVFGIKKLGQENVIQRNMGLISHMEKTNGQMIYWPDREVPMEEELLFNITPLTLPENYQYDTFYMYKDRNIERVIGLANHNQIPILVFFMPVSQPRYDLMKSYGNLKYINRRIQKCENAFKYMLFFNYAFNYDTKYFGDSSHLNKKGAEKFNREFLEMAKPILEEGYGKKELFDAGILFDIGAEYEGRIEMSGVLKKETDTTVNRTFRWSQARKNRLVFPWIRSKSSRRYRFTIDVAPFIVNNDKTMTVRLGESAKSVKLKPGWQTYSFEFSSIPDTDLVLDVEYADAKSPFELGLSADTRTLSVRWDKINIQYSGLEAAATEK